MIKKLRRRFVCINMAIVTLILFVLLGMTLDLTRKNLEADSLDILREAYAPDKKDHRTESGKEDKGQQGSIVSGESTATGDAVAGETVAGESMTPGAAPGVEQKPSNAPSSKKEDGGKDKKNSKMPTFTLSYDAKGALVAVGSDFYDLTDTEYLEKLMTLAREKGTQSGVLWNQSLRFLQVSGKENTYSFVDISNEQSTLWNLLLDSILVGGIAFFGFLILSIFLARLVVKPVEKAWTQQQQFIADASHELKTPLTVIITNAELMEDGKICEDTRQTCVGNILETSRRMRSLTEEMLNLARAENVQHELMKENCNLSELMEDAVLVFEPLFFEQGLELEAHIESDVTVKGNETQLRQLGELLLDNGQKYSLPGKTVLTLKKQGFRSCELTLSNPATPMEEEELEKLFERFYRADPARTASGSYGLGLSIARGIVQRHGGSIKAEQADSRITFTVKLPLS